MKREHHTTIYLIASFVFLGIEIKTRFESKELDTVRIIVLRNDYL